jgi:folate-binding protein YgfZ
LSALDALVTDYQALRSGIGAYTRPRDVLAVEGPEARSYLQGQCSQDIDVLEPGQSIDSLLLAPEGKIDALVRVTRAATDRFVLDVDAGFGEAVAARLRRFKLRSKVDIAPLDWTCIALRGAGVPRALTPPGGELSYIVAVDWNGWGGVDLLGEAPGALVPDDAQWCATAAWEACRVEAGIPVMGRELDAKTIPAEAWLVERTVSFTKGCFTGQELVARLDSRGNKVARRLCGVVAPDADPEAVVGAELRGPGDKVLGAVTSAAWCPGVGSAAGLTYVHRSVEVPSDVVLGLKGDNERSVPAQVRVLPLA